MANSPRCPALQEQHLVIPRNREQFAQVGLGLRVNRDEFLATVAHFHHRHAGTMPIQHFVARLLENRLAAEPRVLH